MNVEYSFQASHTKIHWQEVWQTIGEFPHALQFEIANTPFTRLLAWNSAVSLEGEDLLEYPSSSWPGCDSVFEQKDPLNSLALT